MLSCDFKWRGVLRLKPNDTGRDFVCGDIHGCFDDLEYILRKNDFNKKTDRLFCVGDLIDRGPRSVDALAYYREDWLYTVLGNHEHMFADFFLRFDRQFYHFDYQNGSDWARNQPITYLRQLCEEIKKLPLVIKINSAVILHAALPDITNLEEIESYSEEQLETILWERGKPRSPHVAGIDRVYCGHTIVDDVEEINGIVNLDTGCFLKYYGEPGKLTMLPL
ncbi:MAG: metallophosphoesterase [Spirochaetaceae bacterium]|jgi:serine/threonine protein phosphatase 1|nr:metallophosphoesterase [Spirochaetaceae bacterium]